MHAFFDITLEVIIVLGLVAANGFFVAAEFALVKVRAVRLEALAEAGSRGAGLAINILKHLEAYLAACQLGITMASLGLGWVGEPAVAALLDASDSDVRLKALECRSEAALRVVQRDSILRTPRTGQTRFDGAEIQLDGF